MGFQAACELCSRGAALLWLGGSAASIHFTNRLLDGFAQPDESLIVRAVLVPLHGLLDGRYVHWHGTRNHGEFMLSLTRKTPVQRDDARGAYDEARCRGEAEGGDVHPSMNAALRQHLGLVGLGIGGAP